MCPLPHLLLQGCFRWHPAQVAWPWKSWLLLKVGTNFERLINVRAPAGRTRPSVAQAGRSRLTNASAPCHTNNSGSDNTSVRLFQSCNNAGWSWGLAGMEDMKVLSSLGKMFVGLLGSPALPGTAGNCSTSQAHTAGCCVGYPGPLSTSSMQVKSTDFSIRQTSMQILALPRPYLVALGKPRLGFLT